mmetsp:Transcript_52843/g.92303  ORF Transcript_52843/g.92303 Transcript_52843/m.92303 type:complete len:112 (+) Transcript_52843:79-414(+)
MHSFYQLLGDRGAIHIHLILALYSNIQAIHKLRCMLASELRSAAEDDAVHCTREVLPNVPTCDPELHLAQHGAEEILAKHACLCFWKICQVSENPCCWERYAEAVGLKQVQ